MKLINQNNKIRPEELTVMAEKMFGNLVKAVVDTEREIMAINAELHADGEAFLLERGSKQISLWGINLYPEKRIYTVRDMVMTKVDIHPGLFRDLYIALGEPLDHEEWSVRIYYKPFIRLIWLGGIIMILGGLCAFI